MFMELTYKAQGDWLLYQYICNRYEDVVVDYPTVHA